MSNTSVVELYEYTQAIHANVCGPRPCLSYTSYMISYTSYMMTLVALLTVLLLRVANLRGSYLANSLAPSDSRLDCHAPSGHRQQCALGLQQQGNEHLGHMHDHTVFMEVFRIHVPKSTRITISSGTAA